ncbi:MAG: rRNA adenine N(6)-methyltransferase family protein [Acidimicrobiales bacterium]
MAARRRTDRDERRRRLGQNFLLPWRAEQLVRDADLRSGELVVEIGAGSGALTLALAHAGAEVIAVEVDPVWSDRLRDLARRRTAGRIRVVEADFMAWPLPTRPFRVVGCIPFGETTAILRRLLDDPATSMERADLVVQYEVARKRAAVPPTTLLSTTWAPWWVLQHGERMPGAHFRPVPRVDGGILVVTRRVPPLLPIHMAAPYARFLREQWPF